MIICCSGFIGSGKDTVADYFVNFHGFKRQSFANNLKDSVSVIFDWDRELLEGRSVESRVWRETPDEWWSSRLGMEITPRVVLQQFGTEVCRNHFHNDIWIASLQNKIRKSADNVVITDCRFPNEISTMRSVGAKFLKITRKDPEWVPLAYMAVKGDMASISKLRELGIHESEWAWIDTDFDYVVENTNSIDALYSTLGDILVNQ